MNRTALDKKMAFLRTVEMPNQLVVAQSIKEYMQYRQRGGAREWLGCYGYLVNRNDKDSLTRPSVTEELLANKRLAQKLNMMSTRDNENIIRDVDEFHHVWLGKTPEHTECRLYLRITPDNVYKVVDKIVDESARRELPLYFKFCTCKRNDSIVFYTDYDNVQDAVELLEAVYQNNPELFKGADEIPPLWGKVGGFIGFMEEPQQDVYIRPEGGSSVHHLDKSANAYRTRLLDTIADSYDQRGIQPTFLTTNNIRLFSSSLDISPRFIPINNSSVAELEKAGYNVDQIGTNPTSIFAGAHPNRRIGR